MSHQSKAVRLRDTVERIWRARRMIVGFQLFVVTVTLFVILFWPRTYASTAKLYLQRGRESVGLDPTANATGQMIALQQAGREAEIKSAIDVLKSRGLIEPVVDQLTPEVVRGQVAVSDAQENPIAKTVKSTLDWTIEQLRRIDPASERERAVIEIEKNLMVEAERKSEVISIVYEADTPELAQLVVQALVEEYRAAYSRLHRTTGSTEFFDVQSRRLKEELDAQSTALKNAKNRMGLTSVAGHQTILENQLGEIRTFILETDKQLFAARAKAANLARQLVERPERLSSAEVSKPNAAADLQSQLFYALQIKLGEAEAELKPTHPKVRSLQEQVAQARAELSKQREQRTESTDDINPVHASLRLEFAQTDATVAGLEAQKKELIAQEQKLLNDIKELNVFVVEIEQLERDVKVAEIKYMTYAGNLEEARVDQAMQLGSISSVSIAQPATFQEKPVSPSKVITCIFGALMCLAGPVAIAFANVHLDDTLISKPALRQALGVPVLAVLPQSKAYASVTAS